MVKHPVSSGISKQLCRHISQEVCPWNVRFTRELKEPAFAVRKILAGKDARTLARELLAMSREQFSAAFKGSPMKRATLRGLKRNAAVLLGNKVVHKTSTCADVHSMILSRMGACAMRCARSVRT